MIKKMRKMAKTFVKNESGQGMIEYAILAALLVVAIILIIKALGGAVGNKFTQVTDQLNNTNP